MIKKVGITVRYNVIGYLIGEGLRNVFKNKKSTIASLMIMCATMFVFGIFFLLGEIIEEGETEQIFSMPKHPKTEAYISGRFG